MDNYKLDDGSWSNDYNTDQKFVITRPDGTDTSGISYVILSEDDRSDCPYFNTYDEDGGLLDEDIIIYWKELSAMKEEEDKTFSKSDLKDGMEIITKDGRAGFWLKGHLWIRKEPEYDILEEWHSSTYFDENLENIYDEDKGLDIKEVHYEGEVLFKKEEPKKMTLLDIEKELGYPVEIVE